VVETLDVSERYACRVIGQPRGTQRYNKHYAEDEELLTQRIVKQASDYGRYGYRRVTALLRNEGWIVNHKRVQRIWRQQGLKVPRKQPKRGRLWLNDGSIMRLRPEFPKHVWSYDFMEDRTHNGVKFRILNIIDEYTRECLAIRVARRLTHKDVLAVLNDLFLQRSVPVHIRSDNGSEFTAKRVRSWLKALAIKALFIERFNRTYREEVLDAYLFNSLDEARRITVEWLEEYNSIRPHAALENKIPYEFSARLESVYL